MHVPSRRLATTVGLLAFLPSLALSAAPAAAEPATISGTVLDAGSGQPPPTGACALDGLETGVAYRLQVVSGAPYPQETWWPGGPAINDAQAVVAPATVDVRLPLASTLTR